MGEWLRNQLRDWGEALLTERRLRDSGLNPDPARRIWKAHLSGRKNCIHELWPILMFEAWLEAIRVTV